MKRPTVACWHCSGLGVVCLPSTYWLTLRLMGSGWQSTDSILRMHESWAIERTALVNRLNKLVGYGLVGRRQRPGRRHLEWRREP